MLFGSPTRIATQAHLGPTGVDEEAAMVLSYASGQLAVLSTAISEDTAQEAVLSGTQGRIRIQRPWWLPTMMTVSREGQPDEVLEFPLTGNGYQFEAAEVMRCLRAGKLESDLMPLDESLSIMKTLDAIRAPWGLKYPID
jgi:predicted dehydrogenase